MLSNAPLGAIARTAAVVTLVYVALLVGCGGDAASSSSSRPETVSPGPDAAAAEGTTTATDTPTVSRDTPALATYADRRNRFVIQYPAWWQETNLRQLGDTDVYGIEVVGFADHHGPMAGECYSNMIQVNILEDRGYDESLLGQLQESLPRTLERLGEKNDEVRVLKPWTETRIDGAPAMTMVLRISDDGQTYIGWDCVLVAQQRLYEIEFFVVEEDWETYKPLFDRIVEGFKADGA